MIANMSFIKNDVTADMYFSVHRVKNAISLVVSVVTKKETMSSFAVEFRTGILRDVKVAYGSKNT